MKIFLYILIIGGYGGDMGGRYPNDMPGGVGRSNSFYGNQRDSRELQAAPIRSQWVIYDYEYQKVYISYKMR